MFGSLKEAAHEGAAPWQHQRRRGDAPFAEVDNDTPPETITITDQDLADVVDYEDAVRDDDLQVSEHQRPTTKEVQKIMPKVAPVAAKLDSALARQLE